MKGEQVAIYNYMFQGTIRKRTKTRHNSVYSEKGDTHKVSDYRSITLFNPYCKILVRLLANRLKVTLDVLLHPGQTSSTTVRTIMEATAGIHDVIALGEMRNPGIYLVALTFASAFEKKSHEYLFRLLESYKYGDHILRMIS
jgi:hypothetical protein